MTSMRLGIASWSYHRMLSTGRIKIMEFVERAFELGAEGVELNDRFVGTGKTALNEMKLTLASHGLALSQVTVDNNFCVEGAAERDRQTRYVKSWIDATYHLGAPMMRINAGWPPESMPKDVAFEYAVKGIRKALAYAKDRGIVINIENHGGLTSTSNQVRRFIDTFGSSTLRVTLDPGNFTRNRMEQFEELAPFAANVHAKILKMQEEPTLRETTFDYHRLLESLRRSNYNGYVSLEYEGKDEEETAVPIAMKFLRRLMRAN